MELIAEGISRTFFRQGRNTNFFYAVEKTDFTLKAGELTEILGRSGSGKTTFLNMLCGLLTPSEGRVSLNGEDLYGMDDRKRSILRNRHIGIVPQGQTGLQSLTVLENILAPASMYGTADGKEERVMKLLEDLGIADLSDVYSNELSGGELRRMAIVRALVNEPEIVIADESTGDLDDEMTEQVLKLFRRLADEGASVLMVTHESGAVRYADRMFRMERGVLTPA